MKNLLPVLLLLWAYSVHAQTNPSVTSTEVKNILLGSYDPTVYQATNVISNPTLVSAGLVGGVSADSLRADLFALNDFYNRNMFSDTTSASTGIGAARRWVFKKFQQYSAVNENRLRVGYLKF